MTDQNLSGADRVLVALKHLADHPHGLRLGELAAELDSPKSTTHRILATLRRSGLVEQDSDGRYHVSVAFARLAAQPSAEDIIRHLDAASSEKRRVDPGQMTYITAMQPVTSASHVDAPNPLPRQTLLDMLADRLEDEILSGDLDVGARLPSESALAAHWGVSRPVVREALSRMRARGIVETVNGRGTFVRRPQAAVLSEAFIRHVRMNDASAEVVSRLYEARSALEQTTARLAATRASAAELEQIGQRLAEMRAGRRDRAAWTRADLAFHLDIAAAAHNPFLVTLLEPIAESIMTGITEGLRVPDATQAGLNAHAAIHAALASRSPERAAAAMRDHLEDSQRRFIRALSRSSRRDGTQPQGVA